MDPRDPYRHRNPSSTPFAYSSRARSAQDHRSVRPLIHSQSSPSPPSRRTNGENLYTSMPEPYHSQATNRSPPRSSLPQPTSTPISYAYSSRPPAVSQPSESWQFPEPQIYRSVSHQSPLQPPSQFRSRALSSTGVKPTSLEVPRGPAIRHKHSYSDVQGMRTWNEPDQINDAFEHSPNITPTRLSEEFARVSLDSPAADGLVANGLERFQKGEGDDGDWAWHLLVTKEARESLPIQEVMRQSAMFDLINGERSYVSDMELVQEIFIDGLRRANPPVIPPDKLDGFVHEVFWNMVQVLEHHHRMLGSLFYRQRDQHPILLRLGDIIFDTVLKFQPEYESYIKHYPLAEALHRRELKSNPRYRAFLERCSQDPRLGKRDLITFISRPVTRLPRLSLQLGEVLKRTEKLHELDGPGIGGGGPSSPSPPRSSSSKYGHTHDHPDLESIPIVVDVLNRLVKSTQPGIEASEGKVKFYALCESLRFRRGEIIDMDLYNESRSLVHSGPLARKQRAEHWNGWADLEVALLDNYVLIMKPDSQTGLKDVISRPIPLEYLRLGPFDASPESRSEGGGLFDAIIKPTRPMYPLVLYHASAPARRYTLFANSQGGREKWRDAYVDALGVRKVFMEANRWFAMNKIDDGFFRMRTALVPAAYSGLFTGRITSATAFSSAGKAMFAIATPIGVYVGIRGQSKYTKVLPLSSVTHMVALESFNKLLLLHSNTLMAYSLDLLARVGQGHSSQQALDASLERVAKADRNGTITFFRVGVVAGRILVVYACKNFLSCTLNALEAVTDQSGNTLQRMRSQTRPMTFRPYGEAFYVPKEPLDVTLLAKTIAVATERLMTVVDPNNLSGQNPVPIPDFSALNDSVHSNNSLLAALKAKCESAKPIGIVRSGIEELIVIYDEFGCYVTKHAIPTRKCGYVRWETKALAYAERGPHLLLFSPQFIEIRQTSTGRLVQVIEGNDIRLVQSQLEGPLLIAMRGTKDDKQGLNDQLVELIETAPIEEIRPQVRRGSGQNGSDPLWDEWDG